MFEDRYKNYLVRLGANAPVDHIGKTKPTESSSIFAVGDSHTVYESWDEGASWQIVGRYKWSFESGRYWFSRSS